MTAKPVSIEYELVDGRTVLVELYRAGSARRWVLDVTFLEDGRPVKSHQHAIDGEPEVTVDG